MSNHTKEQLRDMAKQYINSDDFVKKMQLMVSMQAFTGMRQDEIERKIKELAE